MNLLLVTFSLRNQLRDYGEFFVALRGNALQWSHYIEQTYIVYTSYDQNELASKLYPHMEATDALLIVKINPYEYQGWLPKEAWEWINDKSTVSHPQLPPVPPLGRLP